VPRTVQDLIEQSPQAPELAKQEVDVSVLFVDLVGYTRLSERLNAPEVNDMVERCFGAFLDEIIDRGGDVNETAGDGLMVIFKDPSPTRHARAAVLTALGILRRAREISAEPSMPATVALRLGVNSGPAAVGATKIQGRAGARWTYTTSGPVTNIAARLAGLGPADTVIIGPETRRRLGRRLPPAGPRRAPAEERRRAGARVRARSRGAEPRPRPPAGVKPGARGYVKTVVTVVSILA
jgi:class 3 adenylate cyclase